MDAVQDAVQVITFEIGRNRKPSSEVAPDQPLTDSEWFRFTVTLRVALMSRARLIPGAWVQTFKGTHIWNGVSEDRYKVELYYPGKRDSMMVETLKNQARALVTQWDQDAIGCIEGRASMILPRK